MGVAHGSCCRILSAGASELTALLASVTGLEEARMALSGGADLIDLKAPTQGALGALPIARVRQVVEVVAGEVPVSTTVGDGSLASSQVQAAVRKRAGVGVDFIKIALPSGSECEFCLQALARLAGEGISLVAVLLADADPDWELIGRIAEAGGVGVMLDTANKEAGGLPQLLTERELAGFLRATRTYGLFTGLAGSLSAKDAAPLAALGPDYLGFRGALCRGNERTAPLEPQAVAGVRMCLSSAPGKGWDQPRRPWSHWPRSFISASETP